MKVMMNKWMKRLAVVGFTAVGCTQLGGPTDEPTIVDVAVISNPTADGAVAVAPDGSASRIVATDLREVLSARDPGDLSISVSGADLSIAVDQSGTASGGVVELSFKFAVAGAADPCADDGSAAKFKVNVDANGTVVSVTPERVVLSADTSVLLRSGEVALCTSLTADFSGTVGIDGLTVSQQVASDPGTGGNTNDNDGVDNDNINGNDNGSANDNSEDDDDNSNDNNGNGNEDSDDGDDHGDDDGDGDDNDNSDDGDDDSDHSGSNDNEDSDDDSDNLNDNSDDDDSNDNSADDGPEENDNSSDDDSNDNADDDHGGDDDDD